MGRVATKTTGRALRRFVRRTQASDWDALDQALRDAIDGVWSMAASNLAARIVAAARLVGPTPPKSVPWRLVSGGVYDAVLDAGEVPHPSLNPEFVAETDARMAEYVSVHQLMLQSVACVPIRAREGVIIGALYLETRLRPAASFSRVGCRAGLLPRRL